MHNVSIGLLAVYWRRSTDIGVYLSPEERSIKFNICRLTGVSANTVG